MQVLEDEHDRALLGDAFEESPPCREKLLPLTGRCIGYGQECAQPGFHPATLGRVCDEAVDGLAQLGPRRLGIV